MRRVLIILPLVSLLGCGVPSEPEPRPVAPPVVAEEEVEDCEAEDVQEGDYLADCFGIGDPDVESETSHTRPRARPTPRPTPRASERQTDRRPRQNARTERPRPRRS